MSHGEGAAAGAEGRYNISQLMMWGKALVDSNRAHHPTPTSHGAAMRRTGLGHYQPDSPGSSRPQPLGARPQAAPPQQAGQMPPPPQPHATAQGRRTSLDATSITSQQRLPAPAVPPQSHRLSRPTTPNGGSAMSGAEPAHRSNLGAEPPIRGADAGVNLPRRNTDAYAPSYATRNDDRGAATSPVATPRDVAGATPLSVLSALDDEPYAAAAAGMPTAAAGQGYGYGGAGRHDAAGASRYTPLRDTSVPTTPTAGPAPTSSRGPAGLQQASSRAQAPSGSAPVARPGATLSDGAPYATRPTSAAVASAAPAPPVASTSDLMTKLAQLEIRLRSAVDDESACGKCVASLMAVAQTGTEEEEGFPAKAASCLAGLPILANATAELSAIAAKMATQTRDTPGDPGTVVFRTPMPVPPRAAALTSLSGAAALVAARDAVVGFCAAASERLNEVERTSSNNLSILRQASDAAVVDREAQAAVVDAAHETLARLTEELEALQSEITDIGLQVAARKRRLEDASQESQSRQVHIAALRRTARDASTLSESLRQQAQRDAMFLLQCGQDTVALKGQSDSVTERRAAVIAQERQVRAAELEGDAQHEKTDRQIRRVQTALEEKAHELRTATAQRDDTAQAVTEAQEAVAALREEVDALELQHRGLKRDDQAVKENLRAAEAACRAAEADLDDTHRVHVSAERECQDATAALDAHQRTLAAEKARHAESEGRVALLEMALHRFASRPQPEAPPAAPVVQLPPNSSASFLGTSAVTTPADAANMLSPPSPPPPPSGAQHHQPTATAVRNNSAAASRRGSQVAEELARAAPTPHVPLDAPHPPQPANTATTDAPRRPSHPWEDHEAAAAAAIAAAAAVYTTPVDAPRHASGGSQRGPSAAHVAVLPKRKATWRASASADRVSDAETPATTLIGEAIDLPLSPDSRGGPLHVTIQPRLYHHTEDRPILTMGVDDRVGVPRIPSLLRHTPGGAGRGGGGGYDTPVSIVSEPRPESGQEPVSEQPSPAVVLRPASLHHRDAHGGQHQPGPRSMSRASSVYSAPDDDGTDGPGASSDWRAAVETFPAPVSRRAGAPPAMLDDEAADEVGPHYSARPGTGWPQQQQQQQNVHPQPHKPQFASRQDQFPPPPPPPRSDVSTAAASGTSSSSAHPMAAIEARLKSLLARRGASA